MTDVHVMPSVKLDTDETDHELGGTCWCQPVIDKEPPDGRIIVHRRYLDGPARDPDDDKGWITVEVHA
jgi:hypothetical protein